MNSCEASKRDNMLHLTVYWFPGPKIISSGNQDEAPKRE